MIHREGFASLFIAALVSALINIGLPYLCDAEWLLTSVGVLTLGLFLIVLQFFRNPSRVTVLDDSKIYSPCDGKVVVIEEVEESEYFKDRRIQVSIFMSPFNVHVNRNPTSGIVKYSKYHPGKYLVAWHPKSSTENERTTLVIQNPKAGKAVLFRQIAGAMARRIVNYLKEGQAVKQGGEMGFIKFGSRVDLFLPIGSKMLVKLGDKTVGGETQIAEW